MRPIGVVFLFVLSCLGLACSFENRSGAYECPLGNECESPRTCVQNWCILSSNLSDASGAGGDAAAFVCPSECDRCNNGRCIFDCADPNTCSYRIVCPKDVPCKVNCDGGNSCSAGVDCSESLSCEVDCEGNASCSGPIECGKGSCEIDCDGTFSCTGGLDCSDSCACDSSCAGGGACNDHSCPGSSACSTADGCTNGPGACNSCD